MLIGASALWHHGWTTQICRREERAGDVHNPDAGVFYRAPDRMAVLQAFSEGGCLVPQMALADALYQDGQGSGVWLPDPHDLDMDEVEIAMEEIRKCLTALGCSDEAAEGVLSTWLGRVARTLWRNEHFS